MRISFDFDGTLTLPRKVDGKQWFDGTAFWRDTTTPNPHTHSLVHKLHADGHDVILVTARSDWEDVSPFVQKHKLPFRTINYTGGELKIDMLINLGVDIHFDDSIREHSANEYNDVRMVYVAHPRDIELGVAPDHLERFHPEWSLL